MQSFVIERKHSDSTSISIWFDWRDDDVDDNDGDDADFLQIKYT